MPNEEGLFTQDELNTLIGEARIKARSKAESDAVSAQTAANEEVEKANLAAQGEWEKLLTKSNARVKTLEPLEAKVVAYETLIEGMLKSRVKELGEMAKKATSALPETMSSLEKLAWLNENTELFQEKQIVGTPAVRKGLRKGKKSAEEAGHRSKRF